MNWIDFSILFVLIVAFLNGYRRGVFKEVSTLIGLVLAVVFAVLNADWLVANVHGRLSVSPTVMFMLCYILVLATFIIALKILGHYFYQLVKVNPMKTPNKIAGGVFGVLKGLVVLSLVFLLFLFPTPFRSIDNAVEGAVMAKTIRGFVPVIFNNTSLIHPRSGEFMSEVQNGILLPDGQSYGSNSAAQNGALLGMTDDDVKTLDKLSQYSSKAKKQEQ
jgi:membrane protein required for colicin V production